MRRINAALVLATHVVGAVRDTCQYTDLMDLLEPRILHHMLTSRIQLHDCEGFSCSYLALSAIVGRRCHRQSVHATLQGQVHDRIIASETYYRPSSWQDSLAMSFMFHQDHFSQT